MKETLQQLKNKVVGLEDTIDRVTTEKWDLADKVRRLETELESTRCQLKGLHDLQQRQQAGNNEELFRAQRNVAAAEKEQERIQQNYDHAQQTIRQMNATVEAAKKEVENIRKTRVAEEHLARKLVELCNENNKLRAEIVNLKEQEKQACEIMTAKVNELPEVKKYQEQVTRLLQERVSLDCQLSYAGGEQGTFCGGCLSCQLKQAQAIITQTADNLKKKNQDVDACGKTISDISKSHEENRKLVQCLSKEVGHLKNILRPLRDAMGEITEAWPWERKAIANRALNDRMFYLKTHNLNGDC